MYYYKVFDVTFTSSIKLDGFKDYTHLDRIDVSIREGVIHLPDEFTEDYSQSFGCRYNEKECFFDMNSDYGLFHIQKKGDQIEVVIQYAEDKYRQTLMSYFGATGLSVILHYKKLFMLHASGVLYKDRLHLFCGRSGIGKSTLASQLKSKGYELHTDDKCLLTTNDDYEIVAKPGLQILRLWQNSIDELPSLEYLKDQKEVLYRKDKYQFTIDSKHFVETSKKVKAIYIIQDVPNDSDPQCIEVQGVSKLTRLKNQIFRSQMIAGLHLEEELWAYITKLCQSIPLYLLQRPNETSIEDFSSFAERIILETNNKSVTH